MPEFSYKVRTSGGKILEGVLEAPTQKVIIDKIKSQNLIILELKESALGPVQKIIELISSFSRRATHKDIVLFSRQLSTLVNAGVPIVKGFSILSEQIENKKFRDVVRSIKDDVEAGQSISDSMDKFRDVFTELYISMIRAGEVGGILDIILERLANYLESAQSLKGKVKGALVYPAIVSFVAISATIFLLTVVIPSFQEMFLSMGGELPAPTKILLGISAFLKSYIILILGIGAGIFFGFKYYYKTPEGKANIDKRLLKLPMVGMTIKKVAVAKFSRTLGTLIKSGVPILQALETVAKTSGNKVIESIILLARENIKEGERLSDPLKKSGVFPPMVIAMISIGEETGNLDTMLIKVADFYDDEVNAAIEALMALIEPIIIAVMGVVIGAIVICMFLPMFEMSQLAGG
ncbi:MAG: type II secretion system F family protein [Elusimicrobiota bacterium]